MQSFNGCNSMEMSENASPCSISPASGTGVLERLYRVAAGHQPRTNGRKLTTTLEYFHGLSLSKLDQAILKKYPNLTSKDKDKASRELALPINKINIFQSVG
jgi:hypothetical protein